MKNVGSKRFFCFALILVLCSALQAQRGTISGKVTDSASGEPLPGANVVVSSATVQTGAASNTGGLFEVRSVPPGTYTVTVSYIGYETSSMADITLAAGQNRDLNISLKLTGINVNPIAVTASRRPEKALDAPASVTVLEAREIASDVTISSAAILRNVAAVDVSQTGVDRREVVLRGFNNAFSSAAYILTDNRQAAVPSLGVNIHSIMPNMSIDLESVEIVRGPGSALYGAGVDAGVVHYITKDPFTYQGTTFSAGGGERSSFVGQFRHAGVIQNWGYKITGQYAQADDFELNANDPLDAAQLAGDATNPATGEPLNPRNYDYQKFNVNGMLKYRFNGKTALSFNGGFSALDASVLSGIGTVQADNFGYAYGQVRLNANRLFAQAYLNKNRGGDSFVYGTGQTVSEHSSLFNAQVQYDAEMAEGRQRFIFGFDYDRTTPDTDGKIYGRNEDVDLISETGVYVQSQTEVSPKFDVTAALRADFNNLQDEFQFSPRIAAIFKPNPSNSIRATYNRAFASPGNNSNFLDIVAREPSADLPVRIRGRGSAFGFKFARQDAFGQLAGSDLVAYSLNPATLGQPQPVGLPLDATYAAVFGALSQLPPAQIKALLPPPLNGLPDAQIAQLVGLFNPQLTQVTGFSRGTLGLLNPTSREVNPIADVRDISPLKQTITQTIEVGYKGLLQDRVLLAVDAYWSNKKNFVGPLLMETPFVLVPNLAADLQAALTTGIENNAQLAATLQAFGLTPTQVSQLLIQVAQAGDPSSPVANPATPVAIVSPVENAPAAGQAPELLLAYRNFGNINLWGLDVALQVLVNESVTLFGNFSVVSDDFFDNKELDESGTDLSLALNAPKFKTKFGFRYSRPLGASFNVAGRYIQGFPVLSGPYVGDVDDYFLLDLGAGYDLGKYAAGLRLDFTIQNLFDEDHREFIGAPKLGRLGIARLTYSIR